MHKVKVLTLNRLVEKDVPDRFFLTVELSSGPNASIFPIDITQQDYNHALLYFKCARKTEDVQQLTDTLISYRYKFD